MFQRVKFTNLKKKFDNKRKFTHFIDKVEVLNEKDNAYKIKRVVVVDEEVDLIKYASSYAEDTKVSSIIKNMDVRSSAFPKDLYYDSSVIQEVNENVRRQDTNLSTTQLASINNASKYLDDEVQKAITKYKAAIEEANKKIEKKEGE